MTVLKMYVTMFPVMLAGIMNMLFVKTGLYSRIKRPIDGGKTLRDGKRLFGDNKTWAGFFGMIISGAAAQLLWGAVCLQMPEMCCLYSRFDNTPLFNLAAGAAMGFAYVLFELPNSFIKRRLDIPCGKTVRGKADSGKEVFRIFLERLNLRSLSLFAILPAVSNRRRNRNVEPIVNVDLLYPVSA